MKQGLTIDQLAEMMMGEFHHVNERFDAVDDRFDRIETRLDRVESDIVVMKADITDMKEDARVMRRDIDSIYNSQERIEDRLDNHDGYTKEIDHAFVRIARIETHLNLEPMVCGEEE
jgi:septal ring factor EnvC (AmiA/AmiB activator)